MIHSDVLLNLASKSTERHVVPVLCSSRNKTYPPHGRSLEILRERVLKAKVLEAKYEAKLEFLGGGGWGGVGCKTKQKFQRGQYGYFLELNKSIPHGSLIFFFCGFKPLHCSG